MNFSTADLCDVNEGKVRVVVPMFRLFGGVRAFGGPITTLKLFEDNSLVRRTLESPGHGRVLVVDGGGSMRSALVGDRLAELAVTNRWAGIIVYGCIRDSRAIARMDIGICALGTNPQKSAKKDSGEVDVVVTFGGVSFVPGQHAYADDDGVIVSELALLTEHGKPSSR